MKEEGEVQEVLPSVTGKAGEQGPVTAEGRTRKRRSRGTRVPSLSLPEAIIQIDG